LKLDEYGSELLAAFESGTLLPVATKEDLQRIREAARATATKDRRVNIHLSYGDLRDIKVGSMQDEMP
jgi:predicted DNA binding CopG/RHH family protein